jgi:hypothetical protein
VNITMHLDGERWWAAVKDPLRDGSVTWFELQDGENSVGIFASPDGLRMLSQRLVEYLNEPTCRDFSERNEKGGLEPMATKRPDWVAKVVTDVPSGGSRWREIGVGFDNENGESVTVLLDAVPIGGRIVLTRPKRRDEEERA